MPGNCKNLCSCCIGCLKIINIVVLIVLCILMSFHVKYDGFDTLKSKKSDSLHYGISVAFVNVRETSYGQEHA